MASIRKPKSHSEPDPVILEIMKNCRGMVDVPGEYLVFRLHQSGRVEYDRDHHYQPKLVRREYKISLEEIQEVIQFVEKSGFLELAEYYHSRPIVRLCYVVTDMAIEYKSQNHNKRITISGYELGESSYPPELRGLMEKVFQIQVKNRQFQ